MVQQISSTAQIDYPDSDGQPMADNTLQFQWIVTIKENLELLFADKPNVFVAGDLLWYPIEGDNKTRRAPDAMVVFGRPKGDRTGIRSAVRGSYKQWEEDNIAPQVVFEILSPGNTLIEMELKRRFYELHGVEEYYLYNPQKNDFVGWQRSSGILDLINPVNGWQSPRLGIRFELDETTLKILTPDNQPFLTFQEIDQRLKEAETREKIQRQRAEISEDKLAQLQARMRELGIDPDER